MFLAVAPSHLGDGVMALPAMAALARVGPLRIDGPRWARDVYRDVPQDPAATPRTAVLFKPSLGAAWKVRLVARRVGTPTDHRRWLLTDVVAEGLHTRDTYAALAAAVGATVLGPPTWARRVDDPTVDVPRDHVGLNPLSASGAVREWPRFRALADTLARPVVFYAGPGEEAAIARVAGRHPIRAGWSLPAFARALARCRVFVSADTGAAHFAAAVGVPVIVLHGSTSPDRTGPAGAHGVRGADLPCAPCHRQRCAIGTPRCFDRDGMFDDVLARIAAC